MLSRSVRTVVLGLMTAAVVMTASEPRVAAQGKVPPVFQQENPVVGQLSVNHGPAVPIYGVSLDVKNLFDDSGSGGGAGKVVFSDVSVQKMPDALSTEFFRLALQGAHVQQVRIEMFNAGTTTVGSSFLLQDVVVSGFATTGGGGETVTLNFTRLTYGTGGTPFCWDVKQNKAC